MAGGYRSVLTPLGLSAPPVFVQGGYRSFLWFFGGGACAGAVVPPIPPDPTSSDGHGKQWRPARASRITEDLTTKRMQDDEIVAIWLATFLASR